LFERQMNDCLLKKAQETSRNGLIA